MKPRGGRWLAGLRGHHDDRVAVRVADQRRGPLRAALGARMIDQGYPDLGPTGEMPAHPAVGPTVEGHVNLRGAPPQVNAALVRELRDRGSEPSKYRHSA